MGESLKDNFAPGEFLVKFWLALLTSAALVGGFAGAASGNERGDRFVDNPMPDGSFARINTVSAQEPSGDCLLNDLVMRSFTGGVVQRQFELGEANCNGTFLDGNPNCAGRLYVETAKIGNVGPGLYDGSYTYLCTSFALFTLNDPHTFEIRRDAVNSRSLNSYIDSSQTGVSLGQFNISADQSSPTDENKYVQIIPWSELTGGCGSGVGNMRVSNWKRYKFASGYAFLNGNPSHDSCFSVSSVDTTGDFNVYYN